MTAPQRNRMDGPIDVTSTAADEKSLWWRVVLGEFPTGICLIAARIGDDDIATMVVGSFVAISQDPPLVGFFIDKASRSFPRIRDAARIGISVLGEVHEPLSRAVSSKTPDALELASFANSSASAPHLADSVVWFDAEIESVSNLGDHQLVVARVLDFGVGDANSGMPLLFRRAGYGSFAAPGEAYDSRAFIDRLRWATLADDELEHLVEAAGVSASVTTQLGSSVIVLRTISTSGKERTNAAGSSYPFAAPIAPVFAAWASESKRHAWAEASRHLTGKVDRELIAQQLAGVRARGYGVAGDRAMASRLTDMVVGEDADRAALAQMWDNVSSEGRGIDPEGELDWRRVSGIQVPVFDGDGQVVLAVSLLGFPQLRTRERFDRLAERARQSAEVLSCRLQQEAADGPCE